MKSIRFLPSAHLFKRLSCLSLFALLAACGGGGSSDRSPAPFNFTAQTDVALNTPIDSNPVTITSISNGTDISIAGGEYSVAGGAFTTTSSRVNNNQSVIVRVTSSTINLTTTSATLTVGDASSTFNVTTVADSVPDEFNFIDQTDVDLSVVIESAPITVTGIEIAADISITGGEYSLDDGVTFTDVNDTVTNGQSVIVRQTASAEHSTTTDTILTIGGVVDTFSVTTLPDTTPDAFSFTDQVDSLFDSVITSNEITVSGIETAVDISITGGEYSIDNGDFTSNEGTVMNEQTIRVRVTSGSDLNVETETTLSISGIEDTFTVTTHTADANGIFNGTGTVNSGTALSDVKGIIRNERFMLFNEAENVLYDGQIQSYAGDTFAATVIVYKDGVNVQTADATGTIANQSSMTIAFNGTDYGSGTINLTYDLLYERGATPERFFTQAGDLWIGNTNTVNTGQPFGIISQTDDTFAGGPAGAIQCSYDTGMKSIPDSNMNLYDINFDSEEAGAIGECDHIGTGYTGFVTIVDGGTRGTDGVMWFMGANGVNSSFSVLVYTPFSEPTRL